MSHVDFVVAIAAIWASILWIFILQYTVVNSVFVDHHLKTDRHQSSKYNSCIYTYVRTYATVLKLADANGDIFGREKKEKSSSFLRSVCRHTVGLCTCRFHCLRHHPERGRASIRRNYRSPSRFLWAYRPMDAPRHRLLKTNVSQEANG